MNLSSADFGGIIKLHEIAYGVKRRPVFKIPYYQRPYEWGKEHIENLISDFMKNKSGGTSTEYFVGATVLVTNNKQELEVVDGQQRVTTMYLLNMLRFILQRSLVDFDLKSSRHLTDVSKDLSELVKRYEELIGEEHSAEISIMKKIVSEKIANWMDAAVAGKPEDGKIALSEAIQSFSSCMGISQKAISDIEYVEDSQNLARNFWENEKLSICYSRETFNKKLKEALSLVVCSLDSTGAVNFMLNESDIKGIKQKDEILGQYVDALFVEFTAVSNAIKNGNTGATGRDITIECIDLIEEMIEKIEFCAVVTGNEKDAYALFESLNDRNKAVDDLDLIKNLYLRTYCMKSGDDPQIIEKNLERIDELWNDHIFTKKNKTIISLLGAVFITGDFEIDEKNESKIRKVIDSYMEDKITYSFDDICNDIKVYKMIRLIFDIFDIPDVKKNEALYTAESSNINSITYRAMHLIDALGYKNVMSGLVNAIVGTYIKNNSGNIDLYNYEQFLRDLSLKTNEKKGIITEVTRLSYDLWRLSLLSKNYETPRKYAKIIIESVNKNKQDFSAVLLKPDSTSDAIKEFVNWMSVWQYGSNNEKLKVLFIRLLQSQHSAVTKELILNAPTGIFLKDPKKIQLDHLEAADPDKSNVTIDAYFKAPAGKTRKEIVDGLGNFMILDSDNNNFKNNIPLVDAMFFYDNMLSGSKHWLIDEIKDDIVSEKGFIHVNQRLVPEEQFFVDRKARLLNYFKALLSATSVDTNSVKY